MSCRPAGLLQLLVTVTGLESINPSYSQIPFSKTREAYVATDSNDGTKGDCVSCSGKSRAATEWPPWTRVMLPTQDRPVVPTAARWSPTNSEEYTHLVSVQGQEKEESRKEHCEKVSGWKLDQSIVTGSFPYATKGSGLVTLHVAPFSASWSRVY